MKKRILLFVIVPILFLYPQVREIGSRTYFKQGDLEFNLSTNLGIGFSTINNTHTYQNYNYYDSTYSTGTNSDEYSDREFTLIFTGSFAYCIIDGLNFEPEFDINLITDADLSISILANLTYNFSIQKKNTYPFAKIGYGLSNYLSEYDYGSSNGSGNNSLDTKVFNAGLGLKIIYTSGTAMKLEINYKRFIYSNSYSYGDQYYQNTTESDTDVDALTFSIGYSFLL